MNSEPFRAIEGVGQSSTACLDVPPQAAAFLSQGTAPGSFRAIEHLLSDRPLRRPNRTCPSDMPMPRSSAECLVPSREDLRKIRDALPFPAEWHEENEKPF